MPETAIGTPFPSASGLAEAGPSLQCTTATQAATGSGSLWLHLRLPQCPNISSVTGQHCRWQPPTGRLTPSGPIEPEFGRCLAVRRINAQRTAVVAPQLPAPLGSARASLVGTRPAGCDCEWAYECWPLVAGLRPGNPQFPFPRFPIWPGIGEGIPDSRFGRESGNRGCPSV
jgi:hypothetical protein